MSFSILPLVRHNDFLLYLRVSFEIKVNSSILFPLYSPNKGKKIMEREEGREEEEKTVGDERREGQGRERKGRGGEGRGGEGKKKG